MCTPPLNKPQQKADIPSLALIQSMKTAKTAQASTQRQQPAFPAPQPIIRSMPAHAKIFHQQSTSSLSDMDLL